MKHVASAADIEATPAVAHQHRLNELATRQTRNLAAMVGMEQIGLHLVTLAPGSESTEFHFHHQDEEFIYILDGRGMADIGNETIEVGPGDCMGFPAGGPAHSLRNPFPQPLLYLVGGTRHDPEVCEYPRKGIQLYRMNGKATYADMADLKDL